MLFSLERFPHSIKLCKKGSKKEVIEPQKVALGIREGRFNNADFGGFDYERAQTLPWVPSIVAAPSLILEVIEKTIWEKPGDTLYVKEFDKKGYRFKVLVCRTVGSGKLAPITSYPRDHERFPKAYRIVYESI